MTKFAEIIDRIRLPIDEFRLKYAPDSIEKDTTPPPRFRVQLEFMTGGTRQTVDLENVIGYQLFVANEVSIQHVFQLSNGKVVTYQESVHNSLISATATGINQ